MKFPLLLIERPSVTVVRFLAVLHPPTFLISSAHPAHYNSLIVHCSYSNINAEIRAKKRMHRNIFGDH